MKARNNTWKAVGYLIGCGVLVLIAQTEWAASISPTTKVFVFAFIGLILIAREIENQKGRIDELEFELEDIKVLLASYGIADKQEEPTF